MADPTQTTTDEIARDRIESMALALRDHRSESKERIDRVEAALAKVGEGVTAIASDVAVLKSQGGILVLLTEPKRLGAVAVVILALAGGGGAVAVARAVAPGVLPTPIVAPATPADPATAP